MREHFVIHFNKGDSIAGDGFRGSRYYRDFSACPLHFGARSGDDADGGDSEKLLRCGDIDSLHTRVSVGRRQHHGVQQARRIQIGRILRFAARLVGAIETAGTLADDAAFFHWWPAVIRHCVLP